MAYLSNSYIVTNDLLFTGVLNDIKKSQRAFQPIFEAFTNAIEAIKDRQKVEMDLEGKIEIKIYTVDNFSGQPEFERLIITDNGIGFNDADFKRFNTFKDFTKGYKNLGSGRIQYAHYFDKTDISSVFIEGDEIYERKFRISKNETFLQNNALVFHVSKEQVANGELGTKVTFENLLENSNMYNNMTTESLKSSLLERYLHYFCYNAQSLPKIVIKHYRNTELQEESNISSSDLPEVDKSEEIILNYSKISDTGKNIEHTEKSEIFTIDAFMINKDYLRSNDLKLVSKGEIIEESNVALEGLGENDKIKGRKFLFLVSSNYIDSRDTNVRGQLNIPNAETFGKGNIFESEEILIEDIQQGINSKINGMYPAIEEIKKEHEDQVKKLKEMFLVDDETAESINISINDSETKILEKFYEAEAKKTAQIDATIKKSIDSLEELDTTAEDYSEKLGNEIEKLVRVIPLQNKTSLTHYVARRKLVLELLDKILNKKLKVQAEKMSNSESLLHNLLFQQQSTNPETSDLWIISEDFIYFKGSSEKQLSKVEINGKPLFKQVFEDEIESYLLSLGENRKIKRPDVLLFPEEGKCLILEFKSPDVNVSEHLTQIDYYANLIRNYTEDNFQITTFYGYLIGESIEPRDVLGRVSTFEHSYHLDYLFRPSQKVIGFDGRVDGSIYTEVIKYSTLLERAKRRNEIYIEKIKGKHD